MRVVRNLAILALLLVAPVLASPTRAQGGSSCGDCTCQTDYCCKKSWTGSCSCYKCPGAETLE